MHFKQTVRWLGVISLLGGAAACGSGIGEGGDALPDAAGEADSTAQLSAAVVAEETKQAKTLLTAYFDAKYADMATLTARSFEHQVAPEGKAFLLRERDRRAIEMDNAGLHNLSYLNANCRLDYDSVELSPDATRATIKLRESRDVNYAASPEITSKMANLEHRFILVKSNGAWKLENDEYRDSWSQYIEQSGLTRDQLLVANRERAKEFYEQLTAKPRDTPADEALRGALGSGAYVWNAYDRNAAYNYAYNWWFRRNPAYADFSGGLGGDCTNFVSQCLRAGGGLNDGDSNPWYYYTSTNRTASWTGVPYLWNYLVANSGSAYGPYGYSSSFYDLQVADIVQFRWASSGVFQHAMLINRIYYSLGWPANLYLTGHSGEYWDQPLTSFPYNSVRYLRIAGVYK